MMAWGRHVHQWTQKGKMVGPFFLFTCDREPFVAFLRISGDQSAARIATFTMLPRALLLTWGFLFVVIEACLTPKVSVAQVTRNSRRPRYTRRTSHSHYMSVRKCVPHRIYSLCYNPRKRIVWPKPLSGCL